MLDIQNPQIQFALTAVCDAMKISRRVEQDMVESHLTKDDRSPVTVADFAIQALVAHRLRRAFPDIPLVAEESAAILRTKEGKPILDKVVEFTRPFVSGIKTEQILEAIDYGQSVPGNKFWTLDPIDGTKGFLRGGHYAVALAYIEKGRVQLGALGCPNLNQMGQEEMGGAGSCLIASRGRGAWVSSKENINIFQELKISDCKKLTEARMVRSFEASHTNVSRMDQIMQGLGIQKKPILMDSQSKYAVVASGLAEMLFYLASRDRPDSHIKIWDQAAGALIAEESGGKVTDCNGKDLDFGAGKELSKNNGVVVTNGHLHEEVLKVLQSLK